MTKAKKGIRQYEKGGYVYGDYNITGNKDKDFDLVRAEVHIVSFGWLKNRGLLDDLHLQYPPRGNRRYIVIDTETLLYYIDKGIKIPFGLNEGQYFYMPLKKALKLAPFVGS